jgi:hypothetical protein
MSQNIRKSYRDKLLANSSKGGRKFEYEGMELFFRFPTRRDKREILAKSTDKDGQVNNALLEVWATIQLTQVAETKEAVFTEDDFDIIDGLEMGSDFDKVCVEAVLALLGEETDPKELPQD